MKSLFLTLSLNLLGLGVAMASGPTPHHWDYKNTSEWAACSPAYAECKLGKKQSPIDIKTKDVELVNLGAITTSYKPSKAEIMNNGHTIAVKFLDGGFVTLPSGSFKLLQFHFHAPSEEKIDGKHFPMSVHLVHQNREGRLAVIAILLKEGKENMALEPIFTKMPNQESSMMLPNLYDAATILPGNMSYYLFSGSLTTPPCSENVAWQVLKTPIEVSRAQIDLFKKIFKTNSRPVQPLNGRIVYSPSN